jgi:hypothetical protein
VLAITGALVLLVYAVIKAPDAGWGDVRTILPLAGSALLLAAFVLIESRHDAPLVPLRILRSRTLAGANALTVLIGTVAVGMPFVLTLYARSSRPWPSPAQRAIWPRTRARTRSSC